MVKNNRDARLTEIETVVRKHEKRINALESEKFVSYQTKFYQGIYITFKILTTTISVVAGIASIVKLILYIS